MKKPPSLILIAAASALVAGCASPSLSEKVETKLVVAQRQADRMTKPTLADQAGEAPVGSNAHADKLAAGQRAMPTLRRANSSWIGSRMVPVTQEDRLPEVFKEPRTLNFDESRGQLSLATVAARLTRMTGVPVRIQPDVYEGGGESGGSSQRPQAPVRLPRTGEPIPANNALPSPAMLTPATSMAAGGMSPAMQHAALRAEAREREKDDPAAVSVARPITVDAVEMRWQGTLIGYLNHLTDRLGLAWEYRDGAVVIMRFVSEMHEVAAMPGQSAFSFGSGGSASGSSTAGTAASAQIDVQEKGALDAIASIEKAVQQMITSVPGSTITRTDGSGRFLVKTSREMQAQVRDFLQQENGAMRRQAQIQFDVYSVRTSHADEMGVDWSVLFNSLTQRYNMQLLSPTTLTSTLAGGLTFNVLAPTGPGAPDLNQRFGNSQALISALASVGDSVQHRPVSLLAINRMWARTSQLKTTGYLAETTPGPATSTGVGAPGLKTSTVTTGDSYAVMPQILQDNTVLLKFGMSLSDLIGLFDVTVGSGASFQKVQTPDVAAVNQQGTVVLKPGEVMVITGLSRLVASTDKRTLTEDLPVVAGGSRKRQDQREHFIIFVRPVIL
jgi:type IVB pilus formation R64 PilN family outer membrane protein